MSNTTNAYGKIISGSKVILITSDRIYIVGEVNTYFATLYNNKGERVGTYRLNEIQAI